MAGAHEKSSVGHEATRPSGQEGGQHEAVFLRETEDRREQQRTGTGYWRAFMGSPSSPLLGSPKEEFIL